MALLVDLSNNNAGPIDWRRVAAAGVAGVWLKVSEGTSFADATFADRARAARAAGVRVGGYHFLRSSHDGDAQAAWFVQHLGPVGPHDLKPALDCETMDGHDAASVTACARAFNRGVVARIHHGPLFYTYTSFARGLGLALPIGYGLWLADFGPNNGAEHPASAPAPWRRILAHQFTSVGVVAGIPGKCDLSAAANLNPLLAHPAPVHAT